MSEIKYCPICGETMGRHGHRCRPAVLRAIDAANTRAINGDDEHVRTIHRTFARKLHEAELMQGLIDVDR